MASFRAQPPLTLSSARVKEARKLARRAFRSETGRFLADGPKAVEGALEVPGCVQEVFATLAASEAYPALYTTAAARNVAWTLLDDRAMGAVSDSVTPAGLVAVCERIDGTLDELVVGGSGSLLAVCADVRDPGNAGTVIRTADAAGADGVILAGQSVDPYNPKTVRATVGSLFHLPFAIEPDPAEAVRRSQAAGYVVLAADGAGEIDLDDAVDDGLLTRPTAWLFGNEAWGLPDELASLADHRVSIPIHGRAESLNLSTAAAVCLYASAREQRVRREPGQRQ